MLKSVRKFEPQHKPAIPWGRRLLRHVEKLATSYCTTVSFDTSLHKGGSGLFPKLTEITGSCYSIKFLLLRCLFLLPNKSDFWSSGSSSQKAAALYWGCGRVGAKTVGDNVFCPLPKTWEHCHKLYSSISSCTKVVQSIPGDSWLLLHKSIVKAVLLLVPGVLSTHHKSSKEETPRSRLWAFIRAYIYHVLLHNSFKSSASAFFFPQSIIFPKSYAYISNQAVRLTLTSFLLIHPLILRHLN